MGYSNHYTNERRDRNKLINEMGEGKIVYTVIKFDEKRQRNFIYEITEKAIIIIRACDDKELIITKYPARPSRLHQFWENPPQSVLEYAIMYSRQRLTY